MISGFYDWMKNITYFLILFIALLQVLPDHGYRKYVQFFTGLVLVLLICSPVMKLLGAGELFADAFRDNQKRLETEEMEESEKLLEEIQSTQIVPEEYEGEAAQENEPENAPETEAKIQVGEIRIGR